MAAENTVKNVIEIKYGTDRTYECPMEELIPKQHDYLFAFLNSRSFVDGIADSIEKEQKGLSKTSTKIIKDITEIHPFFQKIPDAASAVFYNSVRTDTGHTSGTTIKNISRTLDDACFFINLILKNTGTDSTQISGSIKDTMFNIISGSRSVTVPVSYSMDMDDPGRSMAEVAEIDNEFKKRLIKGIKHAADSEDPGDIWTSAIDRTDRDLPSVITKTYHIISFEELIMFELYLMAENDVQVKKCIRCGRLFPVTADGQQYCNFTSDGKLTCLEQSKPKITAHKMSLIYSNGYRTHFARVRAGTETKEELKDWMTEAKKVKREYFARGASAEEYAEWIKESGKRSSEYHQAQGIEPDHL